ncbi:MAG: LamG domain-containing protein [Saprospiraceae bacterium]|nr:LamG domain-containing protein [Saprospiraceae bacterium]
MKKHLYLTSGLSILLMLLLSKGLVAQPGAALNFDGDDDRIQLEGLNLTGAFTIEAWVKPSEKSDFSTILSNKYGGYEYSGFSFAINTYGSSNGKLYLETQLASVVSSASVTWGVWQHVVITYDGLNAVKMYINGTETGTEITSSINLNASIYPTVMGDWSVYGGNGKYAGTMDEVRVWNYAKCKLEILAQMNCELIGNEGGLLAYYNFNQGQAGGDNSGTTILNDIAGADNNGSLQYFTLNGNASNWVSPGVLYPDALVQPIAIREIVTVTE